MNFTRRKTLLTTGAALSLAGCVDGLAGDGNGDGNDDNDEDTDVEFDVFQLGSALGRPLWRYGPDTGFITLLEDEDARPWMVENPEEVDGLEEWLDETDFEESNIIYVETVSPNTCYNEIGVSDVAIESDEIVGEAEAVDTSSDNEW